MTDLERLWKRLEPGPAPVDDLVREGRAAVGGGPDAASPAAAGPSRRRLLVRPVLTAVAATAVLGAVVGASFTGGPGGGGGTGPGGDDVSPVGAFQADLRPAASCDELLAAYHERALEAVTAWGWDGSFPYRNAMARLDGLSGDTSAELSSRAPYGAAEDSSGAASQRATSSDTGTNVQEEGVDEPDVVKTDGRLLVRVQGQDLVVYDVTGEETERLGSVALDVERPELLLADDVVVALGGADDGSGTRVQTVDLSDPAAPAVTETVDHDGALLSARQHGDDVRLVLSAGLPDLAFERPGRGVSEDEALAANREAVEETTVDDWLPTVDVAGDGEGPVPLLECTYVAVPDAEVGLDTVSVVGFAADDPTATSAVGLAGATDVAYESADHLYLASSPYGSADCFDVCLPVEPATDGVGDPAGRVAAPQGNATGTTFLFDFALDGTGATHVASGEVEGTVADRWAMDEREGVLRVAVGRSSETGPFNSVVTLERQGADLVEVGRLDRLGVGEDIESVRWFDDLAIVVTFRQVDPLYTVDLSDQRAPRLLGALKIPGFSDYLHPLGADRMVGLGEGPQPGPRGRTTWGAQAALFDVTDLADVRRLDVVGFGRSSQALAGVDPRQLTWLPAERTVLTVVSTRWGRVGWVVALRVQDGGLTETRQRVEYGDDVADVRTVPLPDGRVVLLTGEDARFLDF